MKSIFSLSIMVSMGVTSAVKVSGLIKETDTSRILQDGQQQCISIEDNQSVSYMLGVYIWEVSEDTTFFADSGTEICGDGGYVECVSVYSKETTTGIPILASLQFSCSNGYVSEIHGDEDFVGTAECSEGGVTAAYGTSTFSAVTDGGFEGYDSYGNENTISTWGVGYDFENANDFENSGYKRIACPSDRYAIGFEFLYPDSTHFDDVSSLWGFRLICSDEDVCPQNGLTITGGIDDDRDVDNGNDDDKDTDIDDDGNDNDDANANNGVHSVYNMPGILKLFYTLLALAFVVGVPSA